MPILSIERVSHMHQPIPKGREVFQVRFEERFRILVEQVRNEIHRLYWYLIVSTTG